MIIQRSPFLSLKKPRVLHTTTRSSRSAADFPPPLLLYVRKWFTHWGQLNKAVFTLQTGPRETLKWSYIHASAMLASHFWNAWKLLWLGINTWAAARGWREKTTCCWLCFMAPRCRVGHISLPYYQDDSCWPPCHRRVLDINKRLLRHPVINIRMVSVPNIICLGHHSFDQTKH